MCVTSQKIIVNQEIASELNNDFRGGVEMLPYVPVIDHYQVADGIFLLKIEVPDIAGSAVPGQFIHIKCGDFNDPLLRRPFSLSKIEPKEGTVSIIYEVKGRGTFLMSKIKPGEKLDVIGPLGNGFDVFELSQEQAGILIGGGIGAAPMVALAETLKHRGIKRILVLLGAATKNKLLPEDLFVKTSSNVLSCTEDGSYGRKGLVTDLFSQIPAGEIAKSVFFACGPIGMLKAISEYTSRNSLSCQLSMEAVMACGVGACQGCVCRVKNQFGEDYARVCKDGPVFRAREVVWDD